MFNVVQQIAYIHGAIYIIRDREEVHIYTSIEEEDYQLTFVTHTLLHKVVGLLSLTTSLIFSPHVLLSISAHILCMPVFRGINGKYSCQTST
jgi:hypothetical protein